MSFWDENTVYPFAHYVVPLSIYLASRNLFFSLFVIYLWESFEVILQKHVDSMFEETMWDRMVGDPMQGGVAILTAWLADGLFDWQRQVEDAVPCWLRLVYFVLIFGALVILEGPSDEGWAIVAYGAAWIVLTALFFLPFDESAVRISTWVVIGIVILQIAVVAPSINSLSRYGRSFVTSALTLIGVVVVFIITKACGVR